MVIRDGIVTFEHDAAFRVGKRKWLEMALVVVLLPTGRQQRLGYAKILRKSDENKMKLTTLFIFYKNLVYMNIKA